MKLSGWGRYPVLEAQTLAPRNIAALRELVLSEPNLIARGNGRAYGDSAINRAATIEMRHLNRMIAFDPQAGQLVAETGVLLGDIIAAFLPRDDHDHVFLAYRVALTHLLNPHRTSGARETIFMNLRARSSLATGPNTLVPRGSSCWFNKTAELSSNRI